ncbi:calcium-binding protein, partial [Stenoxybacter acetivorans]|uniref:calcium-binding protein n=1 Tax=Stenoxybacter acetivorans TaxID=422441 RepID=UPI0005644828
LILGGAAIGGLFGSDAATDWYELNKDKDQNTIIEMMNKLTDLIFGKDADADISLPKDLDGNQLTLLVNTGEKGIAAAIAGQAKQAENIEWRYALRELNPFAVPNIDYEQYNQDGSLDLYDPKNAPNGMSAEYIEKRAELLILMLSDNPEDNALFKQLLSQGNWDFIDLSENIHIHIGETEKRNARAAGSGLAHQVIFGTDESDDLTGNAGKDWLFGGKGGDTLNGGAGDDYLEGGEGDDTYHIEGSDTVRDTDGSGKLLFSNGDTPNKPLYANGVNANRWVSLDDSGNPIIGFLAYRIGGNDLLLINQKTGDKALIKDYFLQADANSNGYSGVLGIELQTQEQSKDGYKIYNGDQKPPLNSDDPNYRGDYPDNYDWSKVHYDTATGELIGGIFSSGFADVIRGSAEKDLIQGFDGDDAIDGREGDDIIYGNAGDDLLVGGSGADQIYGGDGNDWIASSSNLYIARRIGEKDQWIPPQSAKEVIKAGSLWGMYYNGQSTVWSVTDIQTNSDISESDMIVGGNGNDHIIGGWANDYILGDDFEEGDKDGNDYIQGLAGDDWLFGDDGNDILLGDDTLYGYYGDGVLNGGDGDEENAIKTLYHGNNYLGSGSSVACCLEIV